MLYPFNPLDIVCPRESDRICLVNDAASKRTFDQTSPRMPLHGRGLYVGYKAYVKSNNNITNSMCLFGLKRSCFPTIHPNQNTIKHNVCTPDHARSVQHSRVPLNQSQPGPKIRRQPTTTSGEEKGTKRSNYAWQQYALLHVRSGEDRPSGFFAHVRDDRSRFMLLASPLMPKNWNLEHHQQIVSQKRHDKQNTYQSSTFSVDGTGCPPREPVLQLSLGLWPSGSVPSILVFHKLPLPLPLPFACCAPPCWKPAIPCCPMFACCIGLALGGPPITPLLPSACG